MKFKIQATGSFSFFIDLIEAMNKISIDKDILEVFEAGSSQDIHERRCLNISTFNQSRTARVKIDYSRSSGDPVGSDIRLIETYTRGQGQASYETEQRVDLKDPEARAKAIQRIATHLAEVLAG